ncbi:zinc finger protein 239-like isoform X2 [Sabethes cyaneus]|uniref:zinc finger protein 239-like isoform X2 n=1 Tax=Sabethes cyaneus TaxID=53552 RepID=UPI00237EE089|nr:zinc finger protein 239-like isoform X2 [Sabethes cyaneus]
MSYDKTSLVVETLQPNEERINNIMSEITPPRKQIILKYFRINPDFLRRPGLFPRTLNLVCSDLAGSKLQISSTEVLEVIECWKQRVVDIDVTACPPWDGELKRLLTAVDTRLTHTQITTILQHLEVVGSDSDTLWPTIAVEMRALKFSSRPEIYWRRVFEEWCQEARKMYQKDADNLSALQQRYIDYLKNRSQLQSEEAEFLHEDGVECGVDAFELIINHCRTCLLVLKVGSKKCYLFEAHGSRTTLADKINGCFGSAIKLEDKLPKYVCDQCVTQVEAAYTMKMQIERTDDELRNLLAEYERRDEDKLANSELSIVVEQVTAEVLQTVEFGEQVVCTETIEDQLIEDALSEEEVEKNLESLRNPKDNEMKTRVTILDVKNMKNIEIIEETEEYYEELEDEDASYQIKQGNENFSVCIYDAPEPPLKVNLDRKRARNKIIHGITSDFFQCEQCKAVFRSHDLWQTHRTRHDMEKRFTCPTCKKQFRSASTLKVHRRTHTNERPYVCDICSRSFVQNTNLTYHMKVHRNIRDFPCEQCSYRARNQNDLNLHKRSHTGARPYVCDLCQCSFSTSSNLSKHVKRRHMGERKYKCEQCDKTFTTKETVQKHMVTHTRSKPYPCPECSIQYSWYNGLQKHMKAMHAGKPIPTEKTMFDQFNQKQATKTSNMKTH